jgi:hypothetical protein
MMPPQKPHHMLRVLRATKKDLSVWLNVLENSMGLRIFQRKLGSQAMI